MKSDLCAYLKINISPIFPNSNMNLITWATTLAQAPFCTAGGCAGLCTHDINILYSWRICRPRYTRYKYSVQLEDVQGLGTHDINILYCWKMCRPRSTRYKYSVQLEDVQA